MIPKTSKKPHAKEKEELKVKRNEHVHRQPKVMKPVGHKVKEAPRKVAIKKDFKVQDEVAKPGQKVNKVYERAVVQHPVT